MSSQAESQDLAPALASPHRASVAPAQLLSCFPSDNRACRRAHRAALLSSFFFSLSLPLASSSFLLSNPRRPQRRVFRARTLHTEHPRAPYAFALFNKKAQQPGLLLPPYLPLIHQTDEPREARAAERIRSYQREER